MKAQREGGGMKRNWHGGGGSLLIAAMLATGIAGCAGRSGAGGDLASDAAFEAMMAASFRDQGIATVARLQQDGPDAACSRAAGAGLSEDEERAIRRASQQTIKPPADGRYVGDWKAGEALAQSGRGLTWTDMSSESESNGGSCYGCHQLSGSEIAYGTIGPSLYKYASLHGVTDPDAASARAALEFAWGKLYNSRASNACSGMPRFGHAGILNERQLKDLMALLFDPASPVNR
jgi:sulfur-oxidizing protein SoxX